MLWEHDGDMHYAWEDDDFTAEAAADAQRAQLGPDHVRHARQRPRARRSS